MNYRHLPLRSGCGCSYANSVSESQLIHTELVCVIAEEILEMFDLEIEMISLGEKSPEFPTQVADRPLEPSIGGSKLFRPDVSTRGDVGIARIKTPLMRQVA